MEYKHSCVIDAKGYYITLVVLFLMQQPDGGEQWVIQSDALPEGCATVDTRQPTVRAHADAVGLVRPRWDGAEWVEGATAQEVAAWELAHPSPIDLSTIKADKIAQSKAALALHLESHPLAWVDGKRYSVTAEKQALLNNALAVCQLAVAAGAPAALTWNATGEACTVWSFEALCALALAIAAYVKPLVAHQQAIEVALRAAADADAVHAVVIDYAAVG